MDQKIIRKPYSPEFRERAVRLFVEHRPEYPSDVAALRALAAKLGCSPDSRRVRARQAQRDVGERALAEQRREGPDQGARAREP